MSGKSTLYLDIARNRVPVDFTIAVLLAFSHLVPFRHLHLHYIKLKNCLLQRRVWGERQIWACINAALLGSSTLRASTLHIKVCEWPMKGTLGRTGSGNWKQKTGKARRSAKVSILSFEAQFPSEKWNFLAKWIFPLRFLHQQTFAFHLQKHILRSFFF